MTREQAIMALARAQFRACWPRGDWKAQSPQIRADYRRTARRQLKAVEAEGLAVVSAEANP